MGPTIPRGEAGFIRLPDKEITGDSVLKKRLAPESELCAIKIKQTLGRPEPSLEKERKPAFLMFSQELPGKQTLPSLPGLAAPAREG